MAEDVGRYGIWGYRKIVVGLKKVGVRLLTYVSRTRTCMWSATYRDMAVVAV
jgi:hypothetical protein